MSKKAYTVAVVGATGAVGREMVSVLQERAFPVSTLKPLASERSAGTELEFNGSNVLVEKLTPDSFKGVDIALFSAGGDISKEYAPHAVKAGTIVIDNSSAFRMDKDVPLIVPEVNSHTLIKELSSLSNGKGLIIANPNCSTIQLVVALKPIDEAATLKRVVVSTYQSVSGAGKVGMDELWEQGLAIYSSKEVKPKKFPHQIAFNCIPHIDVFLENGYTKEEMKVVLESRKILELPNLAVTCTAVRVPVFTCHAESVNIETERKLSAAQVREILSVSKGVTVIDDTSAAQYPTNIALGGSNGTFVGRIREDESIANGLNIWVVADNLRKGAALNAVEIAEVVIAHRGN